MYGEKFLKDGGMDTTQIQKIIKNALKTKKFYKSKIDFGLVTFSLTNKKPMELTKSQIKQHLLDDYLMASATCFPAFQKKEINGEEFKKIIEFYITNTYATKSYIENAINFQKYLTILNSIRNILNDTCENCKSENDLKESVADLLKNL